MKEDISMDKLNISNLHKTIILRIKHTETLNNRSSIYLYNNQNRSLHDWFDEKIVWNSICVDL